MSFLVANIPPTEVLVKKEYLNDFEKGHGEYENFYFGEYLYTIDSCHPEYNIPDVGYSEIPTQHKSFNIIQLDNGYFAAQPNNRVIFYDKSLSPKKMRFPDYKVSTIEYGVESKSKYTAGDDNNFFYEFKEQD